MRGDADDLTRPLGVGGPAREPTGRAFGRYGLAAAVVAALGGAGWLVVSGRDGGVARVRVPIEVERPAPASPVAEPVRPEKDRHDAASVETRSGVSVVRGAGGSQPEAVMLTVPGAVPGRAASADLPEAARSGAAPAGRPLDLYAQPTGSLPGNVPPVARVALVVGGLGISTSMTEEALAKLPPAVTVAFAPYGQDLQGFASRAREAGHELVLQVPMEPFDYPDSDPGPRTLLAAAKPSDNLDQLRWALGRISGFVGVMNYMGGKVTANEAALAPILREVRSGGLAFLDDGSSSRSVVMAVAAGPLVGGVPAARADVVVDAVARADAIDRALERLEAVARAKGSALGSATALPVTVERVALWAKSLASRGILLVPVSTLVRTPSPAGDAVR